MCGIAGIWQKNGNKEELKQVIEKMNQSQICRGPDDDGIFIDSQRGSAAIALGHRRLSILDLSKAGKQPMEYQHKSAKIGVNQCLVITFNGEIYNFLELKKELEKKGYTFKTKTDTEVILALYAEYGEESFGMLRGMFAFGLWDNKNKKLFLVKDRYGIKPLYYYSDNEKLVFASTVKALENSGIIPVQKNPEAYISFLLFSFVQSPLTTIKNVFAVPAGYYLEINYTGEKKLVKYYDLLDAFLEKSGDNFKIAKEKIRNLLEESVDLHLISDAPLGVFLSGGLDSSALAALASQSALISLNQHESAFKNQHKLAKIGVNQRLKTLSIIFDEKEFSEQKYQQIVVRKISSVHQEIKITKKDFESNFDKIFEAMDQPTIDGVNTFFIAKAAREAGLKTVLSGLGSDEIFMGYSSFKKAYFFRKIQKLPKILKLPLKFFSLFDGRWSRLSYLENDAPLNFYLAIRGLFTSRETAKILNISVKEVNDFISKLNNSITNNSIIKLRPADLLSYLELKFYLQNQLLKDTDFMSMYHSIEVRVPFLDHKLVEYLSSLPSDLKLSKKLNKPLLIEAISDLLSQEIFNRPKMGFTVPSSKWLQANNWSKFWAKKVLEKF